MLNNLKTTWVATVKCLTRSKSVDKQKERFLTNLLRFYIKWTLVSIGFALSSDFVKLYISRHVCIRRTLDMGVSLNADD